MRTLKYGGDLQIGDFIAIGDGNYISFGFYCGDGRGGTLQYYYWGSPGNIYDNYQEWLLESDEKKKKNWRTKMYEKGFTTKCLWKSYINSVHTTRVMKITNIEDIFTEQEDRETYEKSREVLLTLNFIKK